MSLTQDQIQQIETYLNFKELTHLDLRNEVLDHMAIGIETSLQENKGNFKDALNKEVKKWDIELSNYSSFWLGWSWAGPKILIRKCVGKTKLFYLRTIVATAALMIILHLVYKVFNVVKFMDELNIVLGLGYLVFLGLILFFHLKIRASNYRTSYSFLFKINAIGFAFMYLFFNPLWDDTIMIYGKDATYLWVIFLHSFLLSFAYTFWDLFKAHFALKKFKIV